jgi:hypothetical protein
MNKVLMQEKYGKPSQLTYPGRFHKYQPEKIIHILNKPDSKLSLNDFESIFCMQEPDADYKEGLYYIPLCFETMKNACPFDRNVCYSLFWYIEFFKQRLVNDGFYEDCINEINSYFQMITKDFLVINEYQPHPRYFLSKLKYGLTVESIVYSSTSNDETWKLFTNYFFELKTHGDVGSCWWILISYLVRENLRYGRKKTFGYLKMKMVFEHFHKFGEYSIHFEKAMSHAKKYGCESFISTLAISPI